MCFKRFLLESIFSKVLNCISKFLGVGSVDGVVEADEVFFAYSYK